MKKIDISKKNNFDGLGGFIDSVEDGIAGMFGSNTTVYKNPYLQPEAPKTTTPVASKQAPVVKPAPAPKMTPTTPSNTYLVRGVKVSDDDLNEASKILYSEISNRKPAKQEFEVHNIINTAINRSQIPGLDYGKSLKEVLQRNAQYQGYAPNGTTDAKGRIIPSQYQKVSSGKLSPTEQQKLDIVKNAIDKVKDPSFKDTVGGATFYVHASDGTMWIGKTQKEALQNAHIHEIKSKITKSKFGGIRGMPADLAVNK